MSVNTPLRELILTNVGRVNGIMHTIVEDLDALAAENDRLREENAELRAGQGRWPEQPYSRAILPDGRVVSYEEARHIKDGAIPVTAETIRQSEPGSTWEDPEGDVWGWDGEALRFWFHEQGDPKRPETVLDRYGPLARFTVAPRGDHDGAAETPFGELDETDLRAWIEWVEEEVHGLAATTATPRIVSDVPPPPRLTVHKLNVAPVGSWVSHGMRSNARRKDADGKWHRAWMFEGQHPESSEDLIANGWADATLIYPKGAA